ncbi:acyl-CoA dehydrogenase family protein [Mycolicibacterium moriokaense]|uniref:Alkylation response protein AidB-like acyl-CoA dehydrogenase n=1 Tax=Mycolicibacterium moriokaense TaxID=39691 RepID=A0A318H8F9_9MYCO|nr:acyl-CoA dehydrogenase family protein [Mycolicibacterium moriokaense]PXX01653.1 alkylation response protein AidB-like acyl-CoA dehydrogenase [Mycolicibacterium moriokaense]
MRFELSAEQELFRETARRFLDSETPLSAIREMWYWPTGFDCSWWQRAAGLGWTSLMVPEDAGGGCLSGQPACDAAIVAEEIGRACGPGPLLPVSVTAFAIANAGHATQKETLLPGLLDGTSVAAWAIAEAGDAWSATDLRTTIAVDGDAVHVSGRKLYVEAVGSSEWVLVTGRSQVGLSQVVVPADAAGVTITTGRSVDMVRRFGTLTLDDVRLPVSAVVGEVGGAAQMVERQLQLALVLQCAQINGAVGELFDRTVEYAKCRFAFGRPIGAYQALKHRFADMLQRLEFSRAIADAAAMAFDRGDAQARELAQVAKAYVPDAGLDVIDDCVQINGGIGVTWEHDAHIFSRRVALDRALYGAPEWHKDALVDDLGLVSSS